MKLRALALGTAASAAFGSLALPRQSASVRFGFTLSTEQTTSAGVFDRNGNLVRTLWRAERYVAGAHTATWDGKDDRGEAVADRTGAIRLIAHDVRYVWDGVVGNTSASFTGPSVWYTLENVEAIALQGKDLFVASGYAEGQPGINALNTDSPQRRKMVADAKTDVVWSSVASDGRRLYAANSGSGWDKGGHTFVAALTKETGTEVAFPRGGAVKLDSPWKTGYAGVIDAQKGEFQTQGPTALAVQVSGSLLAVAHGPQNVVRIFDKNTGAPRASLAVAEPRALAFAPNGDLWVVSGETATRYRDVGTSPAKATTITGLRRPLNVAVHPAHDDLVLVADGGDAQQVKAFDARGKPLWNYGQKGGYDLNGPAVRDDRFGFGNKASLAIASDGSFWVADGATYRLLHIGAKRQFLEQVAWLPKDYVATVDPKNPTRVFANGALEFRVDYAKPLLPGDPSAPGGNGSWRLVRNWAAGMGSPKDRAWSGLTTVTTLRNGRTYGILAGYPGAKRALVELPARGPLRPTGTTLPEDQGPAVQNGMNADGDLIVAQLANGIQTVARRRLTGFDPKGDPQWGPSETIASMPGTPNDPVGGLGWPGSGTWNYPISEGGIVGSFNGGKTPGMHLGGARLGAKAWAWRASPGVLRTIPFDGRGSFQYGEVEYAGNQLTGAGRHFVYGYHGEFWNQSQANQFVHFRDDGLFVGQFGVSADVKTPEYYAMPGKAGNSFTPTLVRHGGEYYLWHGEEGGHGGLHRWHVVGADAIQEFEAPVPTTGDALLLPKPTAFPTDVKAEWGDHRVRLAWSPVAGAKGYRVEVADRSGGPYRSLTSGLSDLSYTATNLENGAERFFRVRTSEGAASSEVRAIPGDPNRCVQAVGALAYNNRSIHILPLDDAALPIGRAPMSLHSMFETLGLKQTRLGTQGFALFNADGKHGIEDRLNGRFSISLGGDWKPADGYRSIVYRRASGDVGDRAIHADGMAFVDVTPSDEAWHLVTVFSPDAFANVRKDSIRVSSRRSPSVDATFLAADDYRYDVIDGFSYLQGFNRVYQFRFKGPIRISLQQLDSPYRDGANLSGLFFDDADAAP